MGGSQNFDLTKCGGRKSLGPLDREDHKILRVKALIGLDKESAHLLQLHAMKQSCCTAANLGAPGRLKGIADLLQRVG